MAIITGTPENETLRGTAGDDTLIAGGGIDKLLGKAGSDTYQLFFAASPSATAPDIWINEAGGDASIDTITGAGALMQWQGSGVYDYAQISRTGTGGQHLVIETAARPNYWYDSGIEPGTITIAAQYNPDKPLSQVELIVAGGVTYNLLNTDTGTTGADIMTGWKQADTISGDAGNDYISGGGGADRLLGGAGDDIVFGNAGKDKVYGGAGNDRIFGGGGNDRIWGGKDDDLIRGGKSKDTLRGQDGEDILMGDAKNDKLFGGNGADRLIGGADNDTLTGNKGGDTYVFDWAGDGIDTIIDKGTASSQFGGWLTWNMDEVEFSGATDLSDAIHGLGIQISGDDLVLSYGDAGQITVQGHFASDAARLDQIDFHIGAAENVFHIADLSGDDYTYSVHGGSDAGGDDIVLGTVGDDEIYGGMGRDLMLGGGGADHFMFHDEEDTSGGQDLILDFDVANDILDFTDIAGFTYAGVTLGTSTYGNAQITTPYVTIELAGVTQAQVSAAIFDFA